MTNRPRFSKKETFNVYNRVGNLYGVGHCWHCGKKLVFTNRVYGKKGAWHIDHFPVVYRDIENQCCFGVIDPKCLTNLVPSCVSCNVTHRNERSLKMCGGRSQCKCEGYCTFWLLIKLMCFVGVGLLLSLLIHAYVLNRT